MNIDDMLADIGEPPRASTDANGELPPRFCCCDELLDADRKRRPCPRFHDCDYIRRRNQLLPEAIDLANKIVAARSTKDDDANARSIRFSRALSMVMDKLARPLLRENGSEPAGGGSSAWWYQK